MLGPVRPKAAFSSRKPGSRWMRSPMPSLTPCPVTRARRGSRTFSSYCRQRKVTAMASFYQLEFIY